MVGFKKDSYAVQQACPRLKKQRGAWGGHKTQCSHGWFQKKIMCCQACTSRGLGGRSSLICKHTARMVNGGGPQKDSYYACWVSNSKLICSQASLPLSHARRSPPPPPVCKHTARMVNGGGLPKYSYAAKQACTQLPHLQKHCSHGEWGFKNAWRVSNNDSCAVTQA